MKKSAIMFLFLLTLVTSGCSTKKQIVFNEKLVCNKQEIKHRPPTVKIDGFVGDLELFENWLYAVKELINFYELQVQENNKLCKEIQK